MTNWLRLSVLLCAAPALAGGKDTKALKKAGELVKSSATGASKAAPPCKALSADLKAMHARVSELDKKQRDDFPGVRNALAERAWAAGDADCPDTVIDALLEASDLLEKTRVSLDAKQGVLDATFGKASVTMGGTWEGEPAVKVASGAFKLSGCGDTFYFGARFKGFKSVWSEWVTTQQWSCPAAPLTWNDAFVHYFFESTLAPFDLARGRFFARITAWDASGRELAFRDVRFTRAGLPGPTLLVAGPPLPVCAIKEDPACHTLRDGRYALDAVGFNGLIVALKNGMTDLDRQTTLERMMPGSLITAAQFGQVLDQFANDATKLKAAQTAASRVVDLPRAMGFNMKFTAGYFADEYSRLVQQGG